LSSAAASTSTITLTAIESVSSVGAVGIGSHDRAPSPARMNTYFGDNSLLTKFFAGTLTSINVRAVKDQLWRDHRLAPTGHL
jgi:hypothetical protein